MADRPKLFLGKKGARVATEALKEELGVGDQTADITALGKGSAPAAASQTFQTVPKPPLTQAAAVKKAAPAAKKKPTAAPVAPAPGVVVPETVDFGEAAAPPKPARRIDYSKFGEAREMAIEIKSQEGSNPYRLNNVKVYPLQTRLGFQKQILKLYSDFITIPEYGKEPDFDACKKLGPGAASQVEMYEYQKFVREYVRQASPYRGLLVYHGLGSGKTCSAIAAAEAMFSVSKKKIIVMTPSSLRYNFIREITFCGFRHLRLQNHWVPLRMDGEQGATIRLFASQILRLPPDTFLKKVSRVWVPDFTQPPNFNSLADDERREITLQVEAQVNANIRFINYNGIKSSRLKKMACQAPDADGYGPFDNAVIVIDEIHNLTRLMQGTIEPYLTTLAGVKGRKVPLEPMAPGRWEPELCKKPTDPRKPYLTNYKRGYLFYRLLAGARNSKIIGLSGTPLINFPEEIAILANLIGGYIHTCALVATPASDENQKKVQKILQENPYVDFEEVNLLGVNMNILFSVLPEGLMKAVAPDGTIGVQRVPSAVKTPTLQETTETIKAKMSAEGIRFLGDTTYKSYPLLPPVGEEFRENFLEGTTLKNQVVLRKRLQGLVSYYRGSKKELMPEVTVDTVVNVPFTPYAQSLYQTVRTDELRIQMEQKAKPTGAMAALGKMANLWADIYELSKLKQPNSYRMASRQACNFAFPEGIVRPRPRDKADAVAEIGREREEVIDEAPDAPLPDEKELPPLADENAEEGEDEDDVDAAAAEDDEIERGQEQEALEEAKAGGEAAVEEVAAAQKEVETVLVPEAAPVAGEPIPAAAAVAAAPATGQKKTLTAAQLMMAKQAEKKEQCKKGLLPGEKYEDATRRAKECLRIFAANKLRLFAPGKKIADELAAGASPDPERLMKYSPKFAAIIQKIVEAPGSSLVYSQFLDMEGIGIFSTVLDLNDFYRIDITVADDGTMAFSPLTIQNLKKGPTVNRYLTFTGAQSAEKWKGSNQIRNMALKVFNARYIEDTDGKRFVELPPAMSRVLVEAGFTGNTKGELCRVFCITSAGAEGLSLKNVRRVHIMEPFWNHVRTDQVKGRAVRICSHIDLEYSSDPSLNQRTVEVFTYCSVFAPEALQHPDGSSGYPKIDQMIQNSDGIKAEDAKAMGFVVPEGVRDYFITSDQHLWQLSERKKKVLQNIQDLMKTNAVDCKINIYENGDDGLGCITLPGTPQQYAFHPELKKDIAETSTRFPDSSLQKETAGEAATDDAFAAAAAEPLLAPPAGAEGAAAAPVAAAAPPPPPAPKKRKIQGFIIDYEGVPYIAEPVLQKGQTVPLSYDLYARGDIKRTKKLGVALADMDGNPTADIEMF